MALNFKKIWNGLKLVSKATSTSDSLGDFEVLSSNNKAHYHNGTSNSPIVTEAHAATLTNKSIDADQNTITNIENADIKAGAAIDATKIATGSVDNTEFGYLDGVTSNIQTQLNNKQGTTLTDSHIYVGNASNVATDVAVSGDLTLSNTGNFQIASGVIVNADINASANIDASKLGTGIVSNTEFNYLDGVTSAIQTQLDGKVSGPASSTDEALARFDGITGKLVQNSLATLTDAGVMAGLTGLTSSGTVSSTGTLSASGSILEALSTDSTTTGSNATLSSPTTPFVRLTNASLLSVDMIASPVAGRVLTIENFTGNTVTFNNDTGGTAANRIYTGTKAALSVADQASIIVKYDSTNSRWMVIGGSGSGSGQSLQTVFQLTGTDVPTWSTGNNATFLGGGSIAGTFAADTSTPLHGTSSYKYTQASGSLNDYFVSAAQTVNPVFRGVPVTLIMPYTYNGNSNDIEVIIYDATNAAIIPNSAFIQVTSGITIFKTNVTIPLTCTSIRVGFQTRVANSGKILTFDDVQVTSNGTIYASINNITDWVSYTPVFTNLGTVTSILGTQWRRVGDSIQIRGRATLGTTVASNASISFPTGITTVSTLTTQIAGIWSNNSDSTNRTRTLLINPSVSVINFSAANSANPDTGTGVGASGNVIHWFSDLIPVVGWTSASTSIVSSPDTFNSDVINLVYGSDATYPGLSTLANAPVGTFITYTYAANTNTITRSTAAPTQTTSSINANGIQIFQRSYTAASTAAQPAVIAIQIGKGMKGVTLNGYAGTGKTQPVMLDLSQNSSTERNGFSIKTYDETTGILYMDAGYNRISTSTNNYFVEAAALANQTSAYITISASKNPALTGLNITTIAARGVATSGQAIANATTTAVNLDASKTFDTNGALTPTGCVFTAPEAGYYQINGVVKFSSVSWTAGNTIVIFFFKQGSQYSRADMNVQASHTGFLSASHNDIVFLSQGQTLDMRIFQNRGSSTNLDTSDTYFSIAKINVG